MRAAASFTRNAIALHYNDRTLTPRSSIKLSEALKDFASFTSTSVSLRVGDVGEEIILLSPCQRALKAMGCVGETPRKSVCQPLTTKLPFSSTNMTSARKAWAMRWVMKITVRS